jgi:hypothetical protein
LEQLKKGALIAVVIFVVLVAGTIFYFAGKEYVFRFSESEIQETLEKNLPLTKTYLFIIEVTLKTPRVQLENGSNRVNAGLDIELNITVDQNSKPLGGSIDVSGGVRYASDTGQFFLTDPNIEQLQIQGLSDEYADKANRALTKALAEYYSEHPIYKLSANDAKQLAVRMVLKNVIVENRELVITLGL